MYTIKAKPITAESFKQYGSFAGILTPDGNCFAGADSSFYPDHVTMAVDCAQIAFSPLTVKKPEKMLVTKAEYHNYTGEGILPLDDDMIIHVAPPSGHNITPEKTEAFIVPKGTMVRLNTGVWHLAPLPVHIDEIHILIVLPERVYANDCYVCEYPESDWVEIQL